MVSRYNQCIVIHCSDFPVDAIQSNGAARQYSRAQFTYITMRMFSGSRFYSVVGMVPVDHENQLAQTSR